MSNEASEMTVVIGRSGGVYSEVSFKAFSAVAKVYKVGKQDIIGTCRLREFVEARQAVCYLMIKYSPAITYRRVAMIMKKDMETVRYSVMKIKALASIYPDVRKRLEEAEKEMQS